MDFEKLESQEAMTEQAQPVAELPQWIRDNLEDAARKQTELPSWVLENLGEASEKDDRKLESTETLGGVIREFFRKLTGDRESAEERYDISEATEQWHMQKEQYSCANACQAFIINEYLDADVAEEALNAYAREQNWLQADGTAYEDIGNLLEMYGIETNRYWNASFEDIKKELDEGDRVIVGVYNAALDDDWWDILPIASANHAVEVIGIDDSIPWDVKVIVNDPGVADGMGKVISLDTFNDARSTSGGFMAVAERP